ncbi:uncharacterized protein LOC122248904 [Penaeus japonicus]|uniref:uncharacterized protein LOC122248904 n=1 Tax=Penaeus japonicus TaxID=27405 RepID=UPI001C70CF67|nr:uncharacterized protein LOC122248904 [Penaeus japonicus]
MATVWFYRCLRFMALSVLCFVFVFSVKPRALFGTSTPTLTRVAMETYKAVRPAFVEERPTTIPEFVHSTSLAGQELEEQVVVLDQLLLLMTNITMPCRKLVRQGGKRCRGKLDGDKKLCLDPFVRPPSNNCLVYSFGIGYMTSAICRRMPISVFPLTMTVADSFTCRLAASRSVSVERVIIPKTKQEYIYLYRPLDNIMYLLDQHRANLDVLKVDVDGPEWEIFEDSIFRTDILERTRQLSIEVHLSAFLDPHLNTSLPLTQTLQKYTRVFKGLEERGLRLAHHEPNLFYPKFAKFANRTFNVYYELLWINTHLKKKNVSEYTEINEKIFNEIEFN